jgi:uncharacterized protein (DUF2249 family)
MTPRVISLDTTIARLLDEHPALLEVLAAYHPHFDRLRDPALRRVMAPRVTVAEAARIADVDADALVEALRRAAGAGDAAATTAEPRRRPGAPSAVPMPEGLVVIGADKRVLLDVRDDIARGQEPFARIMAAVKALGADEALGLVTPFEPIPLYDVLGKRGLAHWTERRADGYAVWFYRAGATTPAAPAARADAAMPARRTITLDVRSLEPPLPMVLVLERLDTLGADEELEIIHDRRPMLLYPQLEDRGFAHETDEPEPGRVCIRVRRAARAGSAR